MDTALVDSRYIQPLNIDENDFPIPRIPAYVHYEDMRITRCVLV